MKVIIYRSVHAFLYLPTYIAKYTDIFKTKNPDLDVDFQTIDWEEGETRAVGDSAAVERVIEAGRDPSLIPIALCDPMAIFDNRFEEDRQNLRVIGTLIDKPPFWAISTLHEQEFKTIEEVAKNFDTIIYYTGELQTGNYIGKDVEAKCKLSKVGEIGFEEEIRTLSNRMAANPTERCVAVTVNIIHLAQVAKKEDSDPKVYLNYRFSDYAELDKFLTSCLITTAEVCEKYSGILENIVEAIQRSILVLRASTKVAEDVSRVVASQIAREKAFLFKAPSENLSNPPQIAALQELFKVEASELSANSIIETQQPNSSWLLVDKDSTERYFLEKKEGQLYVYKSSDGLTRTEISWIVEQFYSENFYPGNLATPKDKWTKSIDARFSPPHWTPSQTKDFKETYDTIVSNQFADKAQERIIKEISDKNLQEIEAKFAMSLQEKEAKFETREKNYRWTTFIILGITLLPLLTFLWFPEWQSKFGINNYKLFASGSFILIFMFIVFWDRNWHLLLGLVVAIIMILGIAHIFWESIRPFMTDIIKGLIVTLIVMLIVSLGKIKEIQKYFRRFRETINRKQ